MNEFLDALLQLAAAGVLALGGFAINRLAGWLKLRADSEVRLYLQAALERAVEYGQAEARRRVMAGLVPREALQNAAGELARDYMQDRVPDGLARFKIETAALDKMIRARMPKPPTPYPGLVG